MIIQKNKYLILFFTLFILCSSCAPRISKHGYILSAKEIKIMQKTKLNKVEVIEVFGQPSSKTTFSDNIWYYISQTRREKAYFAVSNIFTYVIEISFDEKQEVKSYKIFSNKDSIQVNVSSEKTNTIHEKDESYIKAFLSSFLRRLSEPAVPLGQ